MFPCLTSPILSWLIISDFCFSLWILAASLSDKIARFFGRVTSIGFKVIFLPKNSFFFFSISTGSIWSFWSSWLSKDLQISLGTVTSWETGTNPCMPSTSTTNPPLLNPVIVPSTDKFWSILSCKSCQPLSPKLLSIDRIVGDLEDSFFTTIAVTESPTLGTSKSFCGRVRISLRGINASDFWPIFTINPSESELTTTPSTISPRLIVFSDSTESSNCSIVKSSRESSLWSSLKLSNSYNVIYTYF